MKSYIRYPYIFPGNVVEQIHKGAMSRYKKVASNSQHVSNRDKLSLTSVLVPCTGRCAQWTRWGKQILLLFCFTMVFGIVSHMGQSRMALPEWMHHNLPEKSSQLSCKA